MGEQYSLTQTMRIGMNLIHIQVVHHGMKDHCSCGQNTCSFKRKLIALSDFFSWKYIQQSLAAHQVLSCQAVALHVLPKGLLSKPQKRWRTGTGYKQHRRMLWYMQALKLRMDKCFGVLQFIMGRRIRGKVT